MVENDVKKSVLLVSLEIWPSTPGGAGVLVRQKIVSLLNHGFRVGLLLGCSRDEYRRFITLDSDNIPNKQCFATYHVSSYFINSEIPDSLNVESPIGKSAQFALCLKEILKRKPYQLVEFYDYCGPAYYFRGICPPNTKIAIHLHSTIELIHARTNSPISPDRFIDFCLERNALASSDYIIAPGRCFFENEFLALYPNISDSSVHFLTPPCTGLKDIYREEDPRKVLFYGRLSTLKGIDRFISACVGALEDGSFRKWVDEILIVGPEETVTDSMSSKDICSLIPEEFLGYFRFTGAVTHDELSSLLSETAFACFPNRIESFCYAAHELYRSGIPLVVNDIPAFRDHFDSSESIFFFDGTTKGLRDTIIDVCKSLDSVCKNFKEIRAGTNESEIHTIYEKLIGSNMPTKPVTSEEESVEVFVIAEGNEEISKELLEELSKCEYINSIWTVVASSNESGFMMGGRRWLITNILNGSHLNPFRYLAPRLIFIRPSDILNSCWIEKAVQLATRYPCIGGISGWRINGQNRLVSEDVDFLRVLDLPRFGNRILICLDNITNFFDLFLSEPDASELSLLLRLRNSGKAFVTIPIAAVNGAHEFEDSSELADQNKMVSKYFRYFDNYQLGILGSRPKTNSWDVMDLRRASSTIPDYFFLTSSSQGAEDSPITIISYRNNGYCLSDSWALLGISGRYCYQKDSSESEKVYVVLENGFIGGPLNRGGRISVLTGPGEGKCRFLFNGASRLIDLYAADTDTLDLELDESGELICEYRSEKRTYYSLKSVLTGNVASHKARRAKSIVIATEGDPLLGGISSPLEDTFSRRPCYFLDSPVTEASSILARNIFNECIDLDCRNVFISASIIPSESVMHTLSCLAGIARIYLLCLNNNYSSQVALARWMPGICSLNDGVSLVTYSSDLGDFYLERTGNSYLRQCPYSEYCLELVHTSTFNGVLIILPSQSSLPGMWHMIAAIHLTAVSQGRTLTVYIPSDVRDQFANAPPLSERVVIEFYTKAQDTVGSIQGWGILLYVYPEEYYSDAYLWCVARGWVPVLGSRGMLHGADIWIRDRLLEVYWEDSCRIAQRLANIIEDYSHIHKRWFSYLSQKRKTSLSKNMSLPLFL